MWEEDGVGVVRDEADIVTVGRLDVDKGGMRRKEERRGVIYTEK